MSEIDVTGFRRAIDGQPQEIREAVLAGALLGGGDAEQLRHDLVRQMAHGLGALTTHQHFLAKELERTRSTDQITEEKIEIGSPIETVAQDRDVLLWAERIRDEFISLPTRHPKKGANADKRDRRFLINVFNDLTFDETEPKNALYQPGVVARAFESWIVLADDDSTGRTRVLLDTATEYLAENMAKKWDKIPKEVLAGYVQELARGGLATEHIEELLASYFEGPKSRHDQLKSYVNFCLSAQYVLDDQSAIDKMTEIASCKTLVLPYGGDIHVTINNSHAVVADVELTRLGRDATMIWKGLRRLSSFDEADLSMYDPTLTDSSQEFAKEQLRIYLGAARSDHETAVAELMKRAEITDTYLNKIDIITPATAEEIRTKYGDEAAEWFLAVTQSHTDTEREFLRTFGHRTNAMRNKEFLKEKKGIDIVDIVTIPSTRFGSAFEIYVPEGLMLELGDYSQLAFLFEERIREMAGEERYDHFLESLEKKNPGLEAVDRGEYSYFIALQLRDQLIYVCSRSLCDYDRLQTHDLNELLWGGVPDLEGEEFALAPVIARRIEEKQRWYVSPRGFEVEFKSDDMRQAGLEKIAFTRPEGARSIEVSLSRSGRTINYRINANWQLDLQGKGIHSQRLKDIIERRTLAILEDYSTHKVVETSKGTIRETGSTPGISWRPPMVVYLAEGANPSPDKIKDYFDKEGKDLLVVSAEREKTEDAKGRRSTYRKGYDYEPDGPPIVVYPQNRRVV